MRAMDSIIGALGIASPVAVFASLILISLCVYISYFSRRHYWKVRGVPYLKPVPFFGNLFDIVRLKSFPDIIDRIYGEAKNVPYIGIYAFHTPVLFVKDLDLTNRMLINDFKYFEDRGFNFNLGDTLGRNLIHQTGSDWRYFRSKLTPCFNISRVKSMLPIITGKSRVLAEKLDEEKVAEACDISLRYTTDVITMCTIGVDANSLQNPKEQFREASKQMLGFHFTYHVFTGCFLPWLHKILGTSVATSHVAKLFNSVVQDLIWGRKKESGDRKDFLQTLLQIKEESAASAMDKDIPSIDNSVIVAQSFIFFLAGFESPGNVLAFTLYELARHPDIQEMLHTEITGVLEEYGGEVTFEALQNMKYLRQVISEALRKYVPLTLIFRRCTKDYPLPESSAVLQAGTMVIFPVRSIHHDSAYYPDPEVFDPERFSEERNASRHTAAFMPFGIGPRVCPAVLYSHMKMRSALVHILRDFRICQVGDTPARLQLDPHKFLLCPLGGIPLAFHRRHT